MPMEQRLAKIYLAVEKYLDKVAEIEEAAKAPNISPSCGSLQKHRVRFSPEYGT